jgi:hypothetical protein
VRFALSLFLSGFEAVILVCGCGFRHQGMDDVDDGVEISEEEFDSQSKSNVEHWVSVHVIPVCLSLNFLLGD